MQPKSEKSDELSDVEAKVAEVLRSTDHPLTFSEVVEKSGVDKATVKKVMWTLLQKGMVKCFLREVNGKETAVYIML